MTFDYARKHKEQTEELRQAAHDAVDKLFDQALRDGLKTELNYECSKPPDLPVESVVYGVLNYIESPASSVLTVRTYGGVLRHAGLGE